MRDGDDGRILIDMLMKSITLCNKYSLYNPEGKWRAVVQAVGRALTGKCAKTWAKLEAEVNNWTANGKNKHKVLVQKLCQKVFKKNRYENQKNAMRDGLTYGAMITARP